MEIIDLADLEVSDGKIRSNKQTNGIALFCTLVGWYLIIYMEMILLHQYILLSQSGKDMLMKIYNLCNEYP